MAAVSEPFFMTVEEYRQLPDQPGVVQELHWGQLVTLTFPKKHIRKYKCVLLACCAQKPSILA